MDLSNSILNEWISVILDYIKLDVSESQLIDYLFQNYNDIVKTKLFEKGYCKSSYTKLYSRYFYENLNLIVKNNELHTKIISRDSTKISKKIN